MGRSLTDWIEVRSWKDLDLFMEVSYTKAKAVRLQSALMEKEPCLFGVSQENKLAEDYAASVNDARKLLLTAMCLRVIAAGKGGSVTAIRAKLKEYGVIPVVEDAPRWYQLPGGSVIQEDPRGFVGLRLEAAAHSQYAQYLERMAGAVCKIVNPRARASAVSRIEDGKLVVDAQLMEETERKKNAVTVDNMRRCCVCVSDLLFDIHLCGLAVRCANGVETMRSENPLSYYWHLALEGMTKDPDIHTANCEACGRPYFYRSRRTSLYCPSCRNWIGKHKGGKRPYYVDVDSMVGSTR